jgi:hypothetical protein
MKFYEMHPLGAEMLLAAGRTGIHDEAVVAVRSLVNAPTKTTHLWKHLCVNCWPDVNWAVVVTYCNVCLVQKVKTCFLCCSFLGYDCMWYCKWISTLPPSPESYWEQGAVIGRWVKVKVNYTLVQALRLCTGRTAHRGSRGIVLLFHDNGTRRGWGVSVTPWPLLTPGKDPVPIVQEAGWS